jgi:hypothetical protein
MADLDEISMMLGEIKSDLRYALRWFEEHENKDQERFEQLAKRIEIHNGVAARVSQVEDTIKEHKPVIEQVKRVRWLGAATIAVLVTLTTIANSLGSLIQNWWFFNGEQ